MALTESTEYDKIEVVKNGFAIQVRKATVIKKDGKELTRSFHRYTIIPGQLNSGTWTPTDYSGEPDEVKAICSAVWTDALVASYKTYLEGQTQ
tara:strand:+ start:472 stop:750 length:279 start_codon:yes stop_codon:yes gene_type:complete